MLFARCGNDDLLFFPPPYAVARIRAHISRVSTPNQQELLEDALLTELLRRGAKSVLKCITQISEKNFFVILLKKLLVWPEIVVLHDLR